MSEFVAATVLVVRAKGLGSFDRSEMGLIHSCSFGLALRERGMRDTVDGGLLLGGTIDQRGGIRDSCHNWKYNVPRNG